MSWVASRPGGGADSSSVPPDLDDITDEELLKNLWQQAEDFSDRRRIRARMYKLREKRLREMVQNDEESLGALTMTTDEGDGSHQIETHNSEGQTTRRKSSLEVKLTYKEDSSSSDSTSRVGQLSMRGVCGRKDEDIIEDRIREVSKGRGARYQQVLSKYDDKNEERSTTSRSSYSVQSNALTGDSYQSMKHKEVRDSVSPIRGAFDRRIVGEELETTFTSDEEVALKSENESVASRTKSSDDRSSIKSSSSRKVTERKLSKELNLGNSRKTEKTSTTSPTRRTSGDLSPSKTTIRKQISTQKESQISASKGKPERKAALNTGNRASAGKKKTEVVSRMENSFKNEYKNLNKYLNENIDPEDEIINEEEEEAEDDDGNIVKMIIQTRKKKDGTQIISRRLARAMQIVEKESDIDEILVGNPDHEVLERNVEEKEENDGSKIKIITETRRRPDGIEYTTKNVLRTSKIFDYDHPEDIAYSEHDELLSSEENTETDEQGITIRTVTETRRKKDGVEYTTKKVYKTSKVDATITPSDEDEILDRNETEEKQSDGTIVKIVIEKRRTKDGQEYTHRQIYRSRKLTLSGIEVSKGMPSMDNDDEVIDRKEKEELDKNKCKIRVVTETRRRKDGSTYSFEYVVKSFKGTESDIENMSIDAASNSSNINVSNEDKIIKEDVKEEVQKDGSIVKTIIERRRAKDGTEYLRHRIMKIPKLPEPELVVGSLDDEVIEEDIKEKILEDGTKCKAITERRRSSTTGVHYTLRRMSKVFHHQSHLTQADEIIDENVTEEEAGNGILVKTVIRRYERPDGSVYTTHDIQKSYKNPVSVNVNEYENDELIDRSYDERESIDGYIIKTIVETRCRTDGTHYTIERMEKVSKLGDDVQVSFKGNSISTGSPGDTVVSCEEHEEPADDGTVLKTILEIRRRKDGTEYTNKISIKSTQVLVPEHETSYVIIKADSKEGEEECSFFPSLDDEIVYVRKKKDVDEKGNPITIVIETRKSTKTGEKYNLTKKVHTTDVVMTSQGEKVLARRTKREEMTSRTPTISEKRDDGIRSKYSPVKKDLPRSTQTTRSSTVSKKTTSEDMARLSTSRTSTPTKQPIKRSPSGDSKPQDKFNRKPTVYDARSQITARKVDSPVVKEKLAPTNSLPNSKSKVISKSPPAKKIERSSDSSPEQRSDSSGKENLPRDTKPKSDLNSKPKRPLERVSSSPARGRSPLRSGTSTPREGTPVRQCCRKSPEQTPPKQKYVSPVARKKPADEKPKLNGDVRKYPKKIEAEKFSKFERPSVKETPKRVQPSKSPVKAYLPKETDSSRTKKPQDKREERLAPPEDLLFNNEPIISLPQTPLTEEMKAYPASSPYIEDVSYEPNLPYHTVHRPSLVREPSEYNPEIQNESLLEESKTTTKVNEKKIDYSVFSSSEDESRKKDSPFKRYSSLDKKRTDEKNDEKSILDKKPTPIIEKTKEFASPSLLSQIIPEKPKDSTTKYSRENKLDSLKEEIDTSKSFSARLSMFERSKPDSKDKQPLCKAPEPEKLVPVEEPIVVSKYIHPLGSESDSDEVKSRKPTTEDVNLTSTRLVMSAIGSTETTTRKTSDSKRLVNTDIDYEEKDIVTPLRERSKSPFSKDSSPRPRSKEGSPAPFIKEDSPGRFLTGKPIDQGPNTTKIKRLERSNSNKKIIYEDLEINAANLPTYLKDIEYISDLTVLEKLLEKAESYEERRIIRGHIRTFKKVDSNVSRASPAPYKRFIESTPSKPSPTSSPILSRRTPTTTTSDYRKTDSYTRKPYQRSDPKSPKVSPTEESKPFRKFSDKDEQRLKKSTFDDSDSEDLETKPRSSVEPKMYQRKSSSEEVKTYSESRTSVTRERKISPTEINYRKSSPESNRLRKQSPEGATKFKLDDSYRKRSSDDIITKRDGITRKTSRDDTSRKTSRDDTNRKSSRDDTVRKTSREDTLKRTSYENTATKSSRNEVTRKSSHEDTTRKVSRDDASRKTSRDDTSRKSSRDDTLKKISREDASSKISRVDSYRKSSPEDSDRNRKSSPEDSTRYRRKSPEEKPKGRRRSPEKDSGSPDDKPSTRKVFDSKISRNSSTEIKVVRKTSAEHETSVNTTRDTNRFNTNRESNDVSKKYTRKISTDKIVSQPSSNEKSIPSKEISSPASKFMPKSSFATRKQTETAKTTTTTTTQRAKDNTDGQLFMEPLRHQRSQKKNVTELKVEQSHMDKIVSPYGVGPTDEYGLPLIGLKALKRRNQQQTTEETEKPKPQTPVEEFVPSDSQGRPLFGLRALKKAPETTSFTTTQIAKESTAVQETMQNASFTTVSSHLQSSVVTQPVTHTRETSPSLVKSVDMSFRRKTSITESDENERPVCLRDIIKLHESKVVATETSETKESPSLIKPKKKLRDSFEPTSEQSPDVRPHRTWDLETDLSTRSQVMENIIAKHETLTKQESSSKTEKKLNGILKKTSAASAQVTRVTSSDSEGYETSERTDTLRSPSRDRSLSPSKEVEEKDTKVIERKTSYTEIKLSKPLTSDGDESKPLRKIKGKIPAEETTTVTKRTGKTTDKKTDRQSHTKSDTARTSTTVTTSTRKTSSNEQTGKIDLVSKVSPQVSSKPKREKSPIYKQEDLFKVDDRKGRYPSDRENKSDLATDKRRQDTRKKSTETVRQTSLALSQERRETEVSKTIIKESIDKDSLEGQSSSSESSDSSSSKSSDSSKRKKSRDSKKKSLKPKKESKSRKKDSITDSAENKYMTIRKKFSQGEINRTKDKSFVQHRKVKASDSSPDRSPDRNYQTKDKKSLNPTRKDKATASSPDRSPDKNYQTKDKLLTPTRKDKATDSSPDRSPDRNYQTKDKLLTPTRKAKASDSSPDRSPDRNYQTKDKLLTPTKKAKASDSSPDRSPDRNYQTKDKLLTPTRKVKAPDSSPDRSPDRNYQPKDKSSAQSKNFKTSSDSSPARSPDRNYISKIKEVSAGESSVKECNRHSGHSRRDDESLVYFTKHKSMSSPERKSSSDEAITRVSKKPRDDTKDKSPKYKDITPISKKEKSSEKGISVEKSSVISKRTKTESFRRRDIRDKSPNLKEITPKRDKKVQRNKVSPDRKSSDEATTATKNVKIRRDNQDKFRRLKDESPKDNRDNTHKRENRYKADKTSPEKKMSSVKDTTVTSKRSISRKLFGDDKNDKSLKMEETKRNEKPKVKALVQESPDYSSRTNKTKKPIESKVSPERKTSDEYIKTVKSKKTESKYIPTSDVTPERTQTKPVKKRESEIDNSKLLKVKVSKVDKLTTDKYEKESKIKDSSDSSIKRKRVLEDTDSSTQFGKEVQTLRSSSIVKKVDEINTADSKEIESLKNLGSDLLEISQKDTDTKEVKEIKDTEESIIKKDSTIDVSVVKKKTEKDLKLEEILSMTTEMSSDTKKELLKISSAKRAKKDLKVEETPKKIPEDATDLNVTSTERKSSKDIEEIQKKHINEKEDKISVIEITEETKLDSLAAQTEKTIKQKTYTFKDSPKDELKPKILVKTAGRREEAKDKPKMETSVIKDENNQIVDKSVESNLIKSATVKEDRREGKVEETTNYVDDIKIRVQKEKVKDTKVEHLKPVPKKDQNKQDESSIKSKKIEDISLKSEAVLKDQKNEKLKNELEITKDRTERDVKIEKVKPRKFHESSQKEIFKGVDESRKSKTLSDKKAEVIVTKNVEEQETTRRYISAKRENILENKDEISDKEKDRKLDTKQITEVKQIDKDGQSKKSRKHKRKESLEYASSTTSITTDDEKISRRDKKSKQTDTRKSSQEYINKKQEDKKLSEVSTETKKFDDNKVYQDTKTELKRDKNVIHETKVNDNKVYQDTKTELKRDKNVIHETKVNDKKDDITLRQTDTINVNVKEGIKYSQETVELKQKKDKKDFDETKVINKQKDIISQEKPEHYKEDRKVHKDEKKIIKQDDYWIASKETKEIEQKRKETQETSDLKKQEDKIFKYEQKIKESQEIKDLKTQEDKILKDRKEIEQREKVSQKIKEVKEEEESKETEETQLKRKEAQEVKEIKKREDKIFKDRKETEQKRKISQETKEIKEQEDKISKERKEIERKRKVSQEAKDVMKQEDKVSKETKEIEMKENIKQDDRRVDKATIEIEQKEKISQESKKIKKQEDIKTSLEKTTIEQQLSRKASQERKEMNENEIVSLEITDINKQERISSPETKKIEHIEKSKDTKHQASRKITQETSENKEKEKLKVKDTKQKEIKKSDRGSRSDISATKEKDLKENKEVAVERKSAKKKSDIKIGDVFCTVDGRIVGEKTKEMKTNIETNTRKKSTTKAGSAIKDKSGYINKEKLEKDAEIFKVPKNSPASRFSKSPEPEEISRRLRKLSKQRKSSTEALENIFDSVDRKEGTARTYSLQSLSASSTTSSVPGYMRPKGESKSYKRQTPERDAQDVEDLLLNSYQYTRCTKRVVKPPVKYDYTYVINTNEGAAGGKESYSIYFGPRDSVPTNRTDTKVDDLYHKSGREESITSSRRTSIDTTDSMQKIVQVGDEVGIKYETEDDKKYIQQEKSSAFMGKEDNKYLDIKQEYENKIKALDLKHGTHRDDSQSSYKKSQENKTHQDSSLKTYKESDTYSDIRQQYQDAVKSISEDSLLRRSSYSNESNVKDNMEASDASYIKYKELVSKDYKDYGLDKTLLSDTYATTDLRGTKNLISEEIRSEDIAHTSSYIEDKAKLDSLNIKSSVDKAHEDKTSTYEYEDNESSSAKRFDTSNVAKSEETSTKKEHSHVTTDSRDSDKVNTITNVKFLPDYDYNKVFADKLEKSTKQQVSDSRQTSSVSEHYSSRNDDVQQTDKMDSYVTFDGRIITQPKHYSTDYTKADPTIGTAGQVASGPSTQQGSTIQAQIEKSSSATVALDSRASAFTSTRDSSRVTTENSKILSSDSMTGQGRSFLDDRSKVSGISDVLSRMGASEAVDHESKITSDDQARSLLNKFLGAQVLMTGVESMMANASSSQASSHTSMTRGNDGNVTVTRNLAGEQTSKSMKDGNVSENRKTFSTGPQTISYNVSSSSSPKVEGADIVKGVNINEVTDDFALNQLLDSCEEYDERRRVRMRLKALMAEKKELQKQLSGHEQGDLYSSSRRTTGVSGSKGSDVRTSEGTSSFNFNRGSSSQQVTSQKSSFSSSYSTQNSSTSFQSARDGKNVSAFDKFKQLDAPNINQNQSVKGPPLSGPLFQLSTSLSRSASGVKDMILTWCQCRTRDYQGVKIENFSTSWNDGMAFCALIHHFYPDAFDFKTLDPKNRRQNFALAFRVADEKAGVMPLLDVDDMVMMKKPDWKCVFTYVQSLYKRLKDE